MRALCTVRNGVQINVLFSPAPPIKRLEYGTWIQIVAYYRFEGTPTTFLPLYGVSINTLPLSASRDNTIRVWEVETGRCLRVMEGHTQYVWRLASSRRGHHILSGSADK